MEGPGDGHPWLLLHLAATAIWLPMTSPDEVVVQATRTRAATPPEAGEWDPDAVLPDHRWRPLRPSREPVRTSDATFRTDRDVAVVRGAVDVEQRPPDLVLARLGPLSQYLGVHTDTPGKTTLSVNDDGRRLGLHLDNMDRLPAAERRTSRNRASLNLGPEPRWFMFLDLDIAASGLGYFTPRQPDTADTVFHADVDL